MPTYRNHQYKDADGKIFIQLFETDDNDIVKPIGSPSLIFDPATLVTMMTTEDWYKSDTMAWGKSDGEAQ